jgi:hypothetical protein
MTHVASAQPASEWCRKSELVSIIQGHQLTASAPVRENLHLRGQHLLGCMFICRSWWPLVIRRGFAAARLLRSCVPVPPSHGSLSVVNVVCCPVEVSATS